MGSRLVVDDDDIRAAASLCARGARVATEIPTGLVALSVPSGSAAAAVDVREAVTLLYAQATAATEAAQRLKTIAEDLARSLRAAADTLEQAEIMVSGGLP